MTDHVESLLPPNATPLERALEQSMALYALDDRRPMIADIWRPQSCPVDVLPYVAWGLGVAEWDPAWPEARRRAVVAGAIDAHRRAGTPATLRAVLDDAGAQYDFVERPAIRTLAVFVHNAGALVGGLSLADLLDRLNAVSRAGVHISVVDGPNLSPALVAVADIDVTEGDAVDVTLPRATGGNAPLTYALLGDRQGLTWDVGARRLHGTAVSEGMTTLTYRVTDADGDFVDVLFGLSIADNAPGLPVIADIDVTEGDAVDVTLPQATGGNAPLTYALLGDRQGLTWDVGARRLHGTAVSGGMTTLTYRVTDADGDVDEAMIALTIADDPLRWEYAAASHRIHVGQPGLNSTLPGATAGEPPYVYTLLSTLPIGEWAYTPTVHNPGYEVNATSIGLWTFTFSAVDAVMAQIAHQFEVETVAAGTLILERILSSVTVEGAAGQAGMPFADGGTAPYTYGFAAPGLGQQHWTISGTILRFTNAPPGQYAGTWTATDSSSPPMSADEQFTLIIT